MSPEPKRIGELIWDVETVLIGILGPTPTFKQQPGPKWSFLQLRAALRQVVAPRTYLVIPMDVS